MSSPKKAASFFLYLAVAVKTNLQPHWLLHELVDMRLKSRSTAKIVSTRFSLSAHCACRAHSPQSSGNSLR